MRKLSYLLLLILTALFISSCVKDSDELVFDNPLDQSGTNWHTPVIDEVYFSDSSIPINDTILFTVKADPEKQHDEMDSAFIYDLKTFETVGRQFEGGYAVIPLVKSDSGNFNIAYWISDKVGRQTERDETTFRVDLYPPEINPDTSWSVPSGQELVINMKLFSTDENGSIVKYYFKSDKLQEYHEQDDPEIMPSWTISDESQSEYSRTLYLKVMDDDGLVMEEETDIRITRYRPLITAFNLPENATKDVELHIGVEASDDDNKITTYKWSINKGAFNANFDKETKDPGFDTTFTEEGDYYFRVICVDAGGVESEIVEKIITVNSEINSVTLSKVNEVSSPIAAGSKVNFEVTANPATSVNSFYWVLKNEGNEYFNTTSQFGTKSFTFDKPGRYSVEVKANGIASNTVIFDLIVEGEEIKPIVTITSPTEDPVVRFRDESLYISLSTENMDGGIKTIKWFVNGGLLHDDTKMNYTLNLANLPKDTNLFKIAVVGIDNSDKESDTAYINLAINPGRPELLNVYRYTDMFSNIKSEIEENGVITLAIKNKIILSCNARDINTVTGFVENIEWAIKRSTEDKYTYKNILSYTKKYETSREEPGMYNVRVKAIDNEGNFSDPFTFTVKIE